MSVSFGLNACDCNRRASVGAPTIHVTHWGAFQVADAIVKGKPTLVLFYDGSSPHQPHNYGQLSDLWRTADVRRRIPGSYVIDVDLSAHPAFFDDLRKGLAASAFCATQGYRVRMRFIGVWEGLALTPKIIRSPN